MSDFVVISIEEHEEYKRMKKMSDNNSYVNLSENKPLSTPTLINIIQKMCEEEYCDSDEFLVLLANLHDLLGLINPPFINEYFYTGNGWPGMEELGRKQHIVNYVYVNMGVY